MSTLAYPDALDTPDAIDSRAARAISAEVRFAIADLYGTYASALDDGRYDQWVACFTANAVYQLTTRENYERHLPIAIIHCDGMGMIEDRAFTTAETTIAQPRSLRHFHSSLSVRESAAGGYDVRANFLVVQTLADRMTEIVMAGRCVDRVVSDRQGLLFQRKVCISDTLLFPTSIVAPV